jgi:hypothetical protein
VKECKDTLEKADVCELIMRRSVHESLELPLDHMCSEFFPMSVSSREVVY